MWLRDELEARFPRLRDLGAGVFVVGGAVRDLLLGREPADVDVACSDPLAAAQRIRPRVIRLGDQEHLSAWRVVDGGHTYDFAALEGGAIDPDLARRDFTVNAMAVDFDRDLLLDPYGGQRDLEARLVRMVRAENFDDDPLRVLKGVRMAVRFGFSIEPETMSAMRQRASRIVEMAPERVTYELSIILGAGALRTAFALLEESGLRRALGMRDVPPRADDVSLAGAYALLVDDPRSFGARWRWSEALVREVLTLQRLVEHHDRLALYDAGQPVASQLPALLRALGRDDALDVPDFSIRPLLDGNELAELLGVRPGKELGRIKRALLEAQVRGDLRTREEAEQFARGL